MTISGIIRLTMSEELKQSHIFKTEKRMRFNTTGARAVSFLSEGHA